MDEKRKSGASRMDSIAKASEAFEEIWKYPLRIEENEICSHVL